MTTDKHFKTPQQRNVGRFFISVHLMDDDPDLFRSVLFGLLVIRCELDPVNALFDYIAIGTQFDEVGLADDVPTYIWTDTGLAITFTRGE